ncbi:TIGR01777 family oxidoreductase [Corynebacterium afermentans]|uniref:TIGR01777 family oxidoreductase n=1 Tax=Corynebacterium afermentans TaxID=38286 RepID=UPI002573114F|nr:TIGR01777 family oxidoreductase [Corynebacterium afermentans]MDC7108221.1 TIGR01777 family oxidoreductase [Corynebacterium afermentans]
MGIRAEYTLPFDRDTVWRWHTRPGAVTRLTPGFLPMRVQSEAASIRNGTTVFRLPAGQQWVARHCADGYIAGGQFTDVAANQPLRAATGWRHVHRFEDVGEGTLLIDDVTAHIPEALLRPAWAYRQRQLVEDLRFIASLPDTAPKTVAMTGSSGLVGTHLRAQLTTAGHTVIPLVRGSAGPGERHWDMDDPAPDLLRGVDGVIHLAGETIMGRFTEEKKRKILDSRVEPTRKLARLAADSGVDVFVGASAVGYYGTDAGSVPRTETDGPGEGFLAEVCNAWEEAARVEGLRSVHIRTGLALSSAGGLLPVLKASVNAGLSARFGRGDFWMSWVALDDLTDFYVRALIDDTVSGPVNATAPEPVTNAEMSSTLAHLLRRPDVFSIPTFGPKLLLGEEGAHELALADQRALPTVAAERGWRLRYPTLNAALRHQLGREQLLVSQA